MIDYPSDDVLIARGRYATLNSERRELIKAMQKNIQQLANRAHHILRDPEKVNFAQEGVDVCYGLLEEAQASLTRLAEIVPLMEELRPLAWETTKEELPF
jgi:hypothetical protein